MPRARPVFDVVPYLYEIVEAAQDVYDAWEPENYAGGGICDDIAEAVADVLIEHGYDAGTFHFEQDNHTVATVTVDGKHYEVDIPMWVYEWGSWYSYTKIPGVTFVPADVVVMELDFDPSEDC